MPRKARTLFGKPLVEAIDLYKWGARVSDICMLYDVSVRTLRRILHGHKIPLRPPHRLPLVEAKPHSSNVPIKSTRPRIPAGAALRDAYPTPDQLLRSSAHAQRDRRTAKRLADASKHSCQAKASECRYAFLRSDNRLPDLE